MNVSLLVSGHEHICDFDGSSSIPTLVDGGINSNGQGTFTASLMKLSPKGIEILCTDNTGKTVLDESVKWQGVSASEN